MVGWVSIAFRRDRRLIPRRSAAILAARDVVSIAFRRDRRLIPHLGQHKKEDQLQESQLPFGVIDD